MEAKTDGNRELADSPKSRLKWKYEVRVSSEI